MAAMSDRRRTRPVRDGSFPQRREQPRREDGAGTHGLSGNIPITPSMTRMPIR
jgi:hypothetical protein